MTVEIVMPKLGFDMQEGVLLNWLKKKGDKVSVGEPIVEIETDKAAIEVESFQAGILTDLLYEPGQVVKVGAILGLLEGEGGTTSMPVHMPVGAIGSSDGSNETPSIRPDEQALPGTGFLKSVRVPARISPLARRLAEEKGIDIGGLQGTGPGGMIVKRDIASIQAEGAVQEAPQTLPIFQADDEKIPLS